MASIRLRLRLAFDDSARLSTNRDDSREELQQHIAKSFQNLGAVTIERADGSTLIPVDVSFSDGEEIFLTAIAHNPSRLNMCHRPLHYLWEQEAYNVLCEKGRQIYNSSSSSS